MKNVIKISALSILLSFVACKEHNHDDHDHNHGNEFDYHAHIVSPNEADKHIGDTIHIDVDFESGTGQHVHNVNVSIMNLSDSTVVYSMPTDGHVHGEGSYNFHDHLVLDSANGFTGHSNWSLTAKVWAHDAGESEVVERIEFHVHP